VDGQVLPGGGRSRLVAYANFVKVAHTIFALPFAVVGMVAASRSHPVSLKVVALAVAAFGAARFAAMGFNRIVDLRYDALNPRTRSRELVAGRMRPAEAWTLVGLASVVFVAAAASLNRLCLMLSPLALGWVLAYSYTKRFTALSHLWLGVALAMAPVGGYLAVAGQWSTPWWTLAIVAVGVACWAAGFDVLYSLQDESFDREQGLHSAAVWLGAPLAIASARWLHLVAATSLMTFGVAAGLGPAYLIGAAVAAGLLAWEHRLVKVGDYSRLDAAFFTINGLISGVVMAGALLDAAL
jgi:4-hydroxybenzoate polyprenyltransferase